MKARIIQFAVLLLFSTFLTSCISFKGVTKKKLSGTWKITAIDDEKGDLGTITFDRKNVSYSFKQKGKQVQASTSYKISFQDSKNSFFISRRTVLNVKNQFICGLGEGQAIHILRWPKLGTKVTLHGYDNSPIVKFKTMQLEKK